MAAGEKMPIGVFTSVGAGLGAALDAVVDMGVPTVQLHAPPAEYRSADEARKIAGRFAEAGIKITLVFCGYPGESYNSIPHVRRTVGLVPRQTREQRIELTRRIADFTAAAGAPGIGLHVGFISEEWDSPDFHEVVDVVKGVCDYCEKLELRVNLETGQETSDTLLHFIEEVDRENLGVNFDPANMILYGSGEPIEALKVVGAYVRSCHCKDAVGSHRPGEEWGEEVPLGEGDVNIRLYLKTLNELGYGGALTIEREISGEQQVRDIRKGVELLRALKADLGIE